MIRLTLKREQPQNDSALTSQELQEEQTPIQLQPQQQSIMPKLRINLTNLNNPTTQASPRITLPPISGVEEQFILRLPPSLSSILTSELVENEYTSPGELSIKFVCGRTAIVKHPRFIKEAYPAVLMDSPTVMETLKSSNLIVNEINIKEDEEEDLGGNGNGNVGSSDSHGVDVGQYYKVADLNQILIVLDLDTVEGQRIFNRIPQAVQESLLKSLQSSGNSQTANLAGLDDVTATWAQWPDGLTLPMRSAKQKRFASRPLHASAVGELERIEKEVERLLKSDGQAIESKFSLISADGHLLLGDDLSEIIKTKDTGITDNNNDDASIDATEDEHDEDEDEIMSTTSSTSTASDIENMNDFAAEIEDNLLGESQINEANILYGVPVDNGNKPEIEQQDTSTTTTTTTTTIEHPSDKLVKDLEAKLAEKLKQAESVSNPLIKARIEDVIRQLEDNLKNLREGRE